MKSGLHFYHRWSFLFNTKYSNQEAKVEYLISELAKPCYAFQLKFSVGGASWTLNPSKEVVNCKVKHTSDKFTV